jgi:hypothetical protein
VKGKGLEGRLAQAINDIAGALTDTHDQATVDRLTGVANRQALLAALFSEVERARNTLLQRALFQKLEGLYFLHKYGNLDKTIWEARLSWAAGAVKLPFYRQWWAFEKTQNIWSAEFIAVIETARDATKVVPWDSAGFPRASTRKEKPQGAGEEAS